MMRLVVLILSVIGAVAEAAADEIVARRTLRVGTIIAAGDLVADGAAAARRLVRLKGLEVRRAIYAGRPVRQGDLGPPTLVRRNKMVVMLFRSGALGLRAEGRALASGGMGDAVEVMNLSSKLTVRATVTGRNQVEVRR